MKTQPVKIKSIVHATHDVLHIVTEKPENIQFTPGQATEMFMGKVGKDGSGNPFTFTALPNEDHLEFMIKTYPSRPGFTSKLLKHKKGDERILNDAFGAIACKGEGTFVAGGAGVTPFICILRDLKAQGKLGENRLLFANKSSEDIILQKEFKEMLGDNFINILSKEETEDYDHGQITEAFIQKHNPNLTGNFYVCGPPPMMKAVEQQLANLNIPKNRIITEEL